MLMPTLLLVMDGLQDRSTYTVSSPKSWLEYRILTDPIILVLSWPHKQKYKLKMITL